MSTRLIKTASFAIASACCALSMVSADVHAADATQPVILVVPFPAGGGVDFVGRLASKELSEDTGRPYVVQNQAGAAGTIGVNNVVKAKPDGHTLVLAGPGSISIAASVYPELPYDPVNDLVPVSMLIQAPILLVANPNAPFNSVQELIDYAKKNPGKLTYGSGGTGTGLHLSGALFAHMASIDVVHVPYKGSAPAVMDLIGGQTDYIFIDTSVMPNVTDGKLKLLAVTSPERSSFLRDTPTIAESGVPGYSSVNWYGLFAPKGTSTDKVASLNERLAKLFQKPEILKLLEGRMMEAATSVSSARFAEMVKDDTKKWEEVVKASGL